jgi:hypothetical protein
MPDTTIYITTGDGTTPPKCQECATLNDALKIANRHGGYIWREEDGMVEVWSNLDLEGAWSWEPAEPEMAAFLRDSR